jgi:ribosomal protein S18 acetylase RimI-like enzyme
VEPARRRHTGVVAPDAEGADRELTVRLRPMTASEYEAWIPDAVAAYAEDRAVATGLSVDVSLDRARAQLLRLLPQGHATPGMQLFVIVDKTDTDVGRLWLGTEPDRSDTLFVWDISIHEQFRGRGLGRAAMLAAEDVALRAGVDAMSLNVFGPNTWARHLYDSLGYEVTSVQMRKPLRRPSGSA